MSTHILGHNEIRLTLNSHGLYAVGMQNGLLIDVLALFSFCFNIRVRVFI